MRVTMHDKLVRVLEFRGYKYLGKSEDNRYDVFTADEDNNWYVSREGQLKIGSKEWETRTLNNLRESMLLEYEEITQPKSINIAVP